MPELFSPFSPVPKPLNQAQEDLMERFLTQMMRTESIFLAQSYNYKRPRTTYYRKWHFTEHSKLGRWWTKTGVYGWYIVSKDFIKYVKRYERGWDQY